MGTEVLRLADGTVCANTLRQEGMDFEPLKYGSKLKLWKWKGKLYEVGQERETGTRSYRAL